MELAAQADADATSADEVAYASPPADARAPRWNQIQAGFVDDPRGSVTQAEGMVDEAIDAFISAARERQAWLASSWQGQDAGTEELRTVLQDYRSLWSSVTEIPLTQAAAA